MSIPFIPGYHSPRKGETLFDLWEKPGGDYPTELWPTEALQAVSANPEGWLIVASSNYSERRHGGVNCVLIDPECTSNALADSTWIGRDLGETSVWDNDRFEDGLSTKDRGCHVQFFAQSRMPPGARSRAFDINFPFLWYWDAFQTEAGWSYVNGAGRDRELVRFSSNDDDWSIEVRTLELRTYLAQRGLHLLVQLDFIEKLAAPEFERLDTQFRNDWCYFTFFATYESHLGDTPAFSGIMGQYVVSGVRTSRVPRWSEYSEDVAEHPAFVYGVDESTGRELSHTCDPDQLGTYFDKDGSRLHYLTPIYFNREVLQPYATEPSRYQLSNHRLSCLGLWGVELSINSAGLVEVYLGDIGAKIPTDEWGHWRAYNVPPEGIMEEGRYRRDFLGQWASSPDPIRALQTAHADLISSSKATYGKPLWKPPTGRLRTEFASMMGPLNEDPSALSGPILTLTKVLVDSIDNRFLKTLVADTERGESSLQTLARLTTELGSDGAPVSFLRNLQSFRSRGGVAHLENSQSVPAAAALGISGMPPSRAFTEIILAATACLVEIQRLIIEQHDSTARA